MDAVLTSVIIEFHLPIAAILEDDMPVRYDSDDLIFVVPNLNPRRLDCFDIVVPLVNDILRNPNMTFLIRVDNNLFTMHELTILM